MNQKDIIAYLLLIYSAIVLIILAYYYMQHSPAYVTHDQLSAVFVFLGSSIFAGFTSLWIKISTLTEKIGEVKGRMNGINNYIDTRIAVLKKKRR